MDDYLRNMAPKVAARNRDKLEPKVAETLRGRKQTYSYRIPDKVMSTKNSRTLASGKSFINAKAQRWLDNARAELATQHRGDPLTGCYCLMVKIYYADGRGHCDIDNAVAAVCDALKTIVIVDDSPKYIGRLEAESRVSRIGESYCEVTLRPL
jgi:Holliday junction resolvase RusA-like endonuclease